MSDSTIQVLVIVLNVNSPVLHVIPVQAVIHVQLDIDLFQMKLPRINNV